MKLFSGIFIICALVTEARSFTCNQCSGMSGTCTFTTSTCMLGTTNCATTSNTQIYGGLTTKRISNSCGPCSDPISFNCGSVVISQSSNCCDTDRCNTQRDTAPRNNTVNGLQCRGCFNSSSDSCSASEQTVDCVGAENRCMNVSGFEALVSGGNGCFAKGCVSEQICQAVDSMIEFSIRFNELPMCCTGDFCNGDLERGTSTPEPGIMMSSPVTSESSSRRTASSKGIMMRGPVTSESSSRRTASSKGIMMSSPVTSESSSRRTASSKGIMMSSPVTSESSSRRKASSKGIMMSSPVTSESSSRRTASSKGIMMSSPVTSESSSRRKASSKGIMMSSPVTSESSSRRTASSKGIMMSSPVTSESSSRRTASSKASTLKCFSCENVISKCTQQEVCDPALNLNCRTILARWTLDSISQESFIYRCGNCTGNLSFNGGRLSAAVSERCCQSDLCNNQTITEEANATLNGLECNTCATPLVGMCQDAKEMVKCAGKQTRCLHSSIMYLSRNYTIKGCASESICKNANTITIQNIQLSQEIYCCNRSGCNGSPGSTAQTATLANNVTVHNDSPAVHSLIALPLITLILCMF
ncbi:flocculation protein FLO11-like isoform X2 [Scyliorhinus canicula]|uniref:flocculation protein FLO11-like isoform X2 n=1 Tax=Scyliorhinus canicula TaxID=7830 RepID=UPI0018F669AC|nr:flocculation protein FLO11-like isoform X2 [Scyliorhinus canicula]